MLAHGAIFGNLPLWFLTTLFCVVILYNYLVNRRVNKIVIIFVSLTIPFMIHLLKLPLPFYLKNIPLGIFFFAMGNYLKEKQYKNTWAVISIIIAILILVFIPSRVDFRSNTLGCGYYLFWVVYSLTGIISLNFLFKKFGKIISKTPLQDIGEKSMDYYVWHFILILISGIIYRDILHIEEPYILLFLTIITMILLFPLCFIISKKWLQLTINFDKKR